jgi:DNA polymerase-3 subunit alpha/error-prone DNA polymerase
VPSRLGVRSAYSLLYSVRSPADIAQRAAAYGATALSIADRDNLYGLHTFLDAAKEAGLRPVAGAELSSGKGSVFAFVRDRRGFARLCELLSDGSRYDGSRRDRRRDGSFDLATALRADSAGLVLASSSPDLLAALAGKVPSLYAALTPRSLAALVPSRRLGLPIVALDDATFLDTDDYAVHAALRSIDLGKTVGSLAEGDAASPDERLLPWPELERRLASWPEALRATDEIAAACVFDTAFGGFVFPDYPTGSGPVAGARASELLRARVYAGAERRYGELSDTVVERIESELGIIGRKGFAPYFLIMDDIVSMASRTCGRGSGAASIVSYALSITNVDPIAHNLYFERFLNMARLDPPDIDVDFAWDERDELIRRVIERFGADRCARVANHNTFRPRSALRETAKAYGLPGLDISRMERSLLELGEGHGGPDPLWAEILAIARRIEGLPRGLSMHCGGLVIAPGPIRRYAPVESSAEGFPLLAWEKEGTEAAGLVKIDLLGNRSLAVIRDALAMLEEQGLGIDQDLWRPAEDAATIAALARGDSMGVFYIESPAMRQLQKKTGRGDFEHIVIHSSIIRPAANKFISEYVRRLKGKVEWEALHPRLANIFDETYGILCYQEDVSKTAVALAGFSEVDADALRKAIAKKSGGGRLREYEKLFFDGCRANGVEEETIGKVWEMMLSFDGYSFCKPHSASYAMVSFQSAYLRVHQPAPFMAAVLSNQGGYYRPQAYISEARRMGLRIVGPDVNASRYPYRGEGDTVVVGLMAIARLSRAGADAIIAERGRRGSFASPGDLSRRVRLSRDDIVALVAAGAFDSLDPGTRRPTMARALLGSAGASGAGGGQADLFDAVAAGPALAPSSRASSPERALATARRADAELREEYAALGFLRELHPFALWGRELSRIDRIPAAELERHRGRRVRLLGWPVTQKEVTTKDGLGMDFVSFEDETALYETVLFPEAYERCRRLLFDQRPLLVLGTVKEDEGALNVEVESLRAIATA